MNQQLRVNGHKLALAISGPEDGPVVVFLHHGLGAIRSWKGQLEAFNSAGFRVLAYDRFGHGKSESRVEWGMPDFEQDLADLQAILAEFAFAQVSLIGHSDGGNIALLYALKYPQQVNCLVIIAAHIYIEAKMSSGINSIKRRFEKDLRFQEQMRRVHAENSESLFWGWFNCWTNPSVQNWDMRPSLAQIGCPTLVVQGTDDEHATPQHARDLAASIPGAQLMLVTGAGHMLPQEQPDQINLRLLRFLEQALAAKFDH